MRIADKRRAVASALAVIIGAVLPLAANTAEIHRCVDGGRVTYTDRGCSQQGEVIAVAGMMTVSTTSRDDVNAYGRATPVVLGMSPRMVYETMGRPMETIATLEGRNLIEYWTYRGIEGITRVAFQDGRVTRIQPR